MVAKKFFRKGLMSVVIPKTFSYEIPVYDRVHGDKGYNLDLLSYAVFGQLALLMMKGGKCGFEYRVEVSGDTVTGTMEVTSFEGDIVHHVDVETT